MRRPPWPVAATRAPGRAAANPAMAMKTEQPSSMASPTICSTNFGERWAEATRSWYGTSKCSKIFVHFWAIGRSEEDPNKMVTSMLNRHRGWFFMMTDSTHEGRTLILRQNEQLKGRRGWKNQDQSNGVKARHPQEQVAPNKGRLPRPRPVRTR